MLFTRLGFKTGLVRSVKNSNGLTKRWLGCAASGKMRLDVSHCSCCLQPSPALAISPSSTARGYHLSFSKLCIVELSSEKKQQIALDEYPRWWFIFYPMLAFDTVMKTQFFVKSATFQIYKHISQKLFVVVR